MKNQGKVSKGQSTELSRKEKRKLLRKEKKQKKNSFYQRKDHSHTVQHSPINKNTSSTKIKTSKQNTVKQQVKSPRLAIKKEVKIEEPKVMINKKRQAKQQQILTKVKKNPQKTEKQLQNQEELLREEKQIAYYESLLGVGKKKNKYKSIAKGMGYEDDLFDFLDNISKKVKGDKKSYEADESNGLEEELEGGDEEGFDSEEDYDGLEGISEEEELDGQEMQVEQEPEQQQIDSNQNSNLSDSQEEENFQEEQEHEEEDHDDSQNQEQLDEQLNQIEKQDEYEQYSRQNDEELDPEEQAMWKKLKNESIRQKQPLKTEHKNKNLNPKPSQLSKQPKVQHQQNTLQKNQSNKPSTQTPSGRRPLFGNMTPQQKQQQEIRKQMNGLFNKLSDGNLMITFRQFSSIFLSSSKSNAIPVFVNLFVRFNVEVEKPHLHILLSNIALASALHHLIGNRLMAPLIHELVKLFEEYEQTEEDFEEIQQIGYSKLFEKKKNIIVILSYLYEFKSLTGDFIYSLVQNLSHQLNEHHVEFLYIIIQKIGSKIRQNDPGILKEIVDTLKESIQAFKQSSTNKDNELSKINIIQLELNELKFNRKQPMFLDQRMAFFTTFLTKNVPNELNTEKDIILANYSQIKTADTSRTNWWENLSNSNQLANPQMKDDKQDIEMMNELTAERKKLLDLAKSLNLVTEIRKNIFVEIMQASDYIEATQRVLTLKIKNLQEIAVVLVQVCVLQPTFNPFYPLVAAKIANINPKFKSKVQFTIWDHVKLLESYNARKASNLAKFAARFVGNELTNGSLSILKYFPDFINIPAHEAMFLMIFFSEFFSVCKKPTLVQISKKLKEDGNRQIKEAILEYLNEVGVREKGFNNMEKMKFLKRMILLNDSQHEHEQRY